jgi:hypothetical protein
MRLANRLALIFALLCWIVLAAGSLARLGWLPGPKMRDEYGPIPHFGWIEKGEPRPTPHIAETEFGLAPAPVLRTGIDPTGMKFTELGDPPSMCFRSGGAACLRRNWREVLKRFGDTELAAPPGARSYRFLGFPSFSDWVSVQLDVRPDGTGMLVTSWVDHADGAAVGSGARPVTAPVSQTETEIVERGIARSAFGRMVADPSALWGQHACLDGATWVFEAYVRDRYRYVARHSCQAGEAQIKAMGKLLVDLARRKTPDARFEHGRPPIP